MSEMITRIQFAPGGKVTIYSDSGVFDIWTGQKARVLRDLVQESVKQIIERELRDSTRGEETPEEGEIEEEAVGVPI